MSYHRQKQLTVFGDLVNQQVRGLLKLSGLTQRAFADMLGVSEHHVSKLLCGHNDWTPAMLDKIGEIAGIEWTVGWTGGPPELAP